ncbi:MAG: 6,7-dimethyl-8-ribityllumazine synthase [Mariniblastus sp.]|nr:6,7-dimethyl-8-ribityllumazine synthase [Mariniblastus sp.]
MDGFSGRMHEGRTGSLEGMRFAVVVSRYNETITEKLLNGAIEKLRAHGVQDQQVEVFRVPGAWEISLAAKWALPSADAVICLGAVIRGETSHDAHINSTVSSQLGQLMVDSGKPVAFGVLTCNNLEQAIQRSGGSVGNKGHEAVDAVVEMLRLRENARD